MTDWLTGCLNSLVLFRPWVAGFYLYLSLPAICQPTKADSCTLTNSSWLIRPEQRLSFTQANALILQFLPVFLCRETTTPFQVSVFYFELFCHQNNCRPTQQLDSFYCCTLPMPRAEIYIEIFIGDSEKPRSQKWWFKILFLSCFYTKSRMEDKERSDLWMGLNFGLL